MPDDEVCATEKSEFSEALKKENKKTQAETCLRAFLDSRCDWRIPACCGNRTKYSRAYYEP